MTIIQILPDAKLGIVGLGDDGVLYFFNRSVNKWQKVGKSE